LLAEGRLLRDQARAQREDVARWQRAREALDRIAEELGPRLAASLSVLRGEVDAGLKAAEADRALLARLVDIRSAHGDDADNTATDAAYAYAFAEVGIDPDGGNPAAAGAMVARRPATVAAALVAALDHWAVVRRNRFAKDLDWTRLLATARAADPDPNRVSLRDALLVQDKRDRLARLRPLARRADAGSWAPASLVLLGAALGEADDMDAGVAVLRQASWAHPEDARVHNALGMLLEGMPPIQMEEVIRAYTAAWARQPELAGHALAHALERRGRRAEAGAVWHDLVGRRPDNSRHQACYGLNLESQDRDAEAAPVLGRAVAALRKAIRLRPDDASSHSKLGSVLHASGDLPGAVAALHEALRLRPDDASAQNNLGDVLRESGDLTGAVAAFREAIRLRLNFADAHAGLGMALRASGDLLGAVASFREAIRLRPEFPEAHGNLGNVLKDLGDLRGAIAADREALRLRPDFPQGHFNLGVVLQDSGDLPGAVTAFREAIRLQPDYANAHNHLGGALVRSGDLPGALVAFREAVRVQPDFADPYNNLGNVLSSSGDLPGAVAAFREAARLRPDLAEPHGNLGLILRQQGRYPEALVEFRKAHDLGSKRASWPYPSAQWVAQAERLVALADRLPAVLGGTDRPANNGERLAFAQMLYDTKRYASAARLWSEALDSDPKLAGNPRTALRYNAACAAALAAAGKGEDDPKPDEAARALLRQRALGWLKDELAAWSEILDSADAKARAAMIPVLLHWQKDPDLTVIREGDALAALSAAERADWLVLWAEVDRLLEQAKKPR
jgi:tetratricopeptide (TPR) repeat protein